MNRQTVVSAPLIFARRLALALMFLCLVIFVGGMVLFPATAETNLDFVRPQNTWTDPVLRAAIADAGLTVGALAYFRLATVLFPALFYLIVAGIIFTRHASDWFGTYLSVLFVVFGTVANNMAHSVGSFHPALAVIISGLGNGGWIGLFPVFYLFPDGKFVPRWTRWVMVLWLSFVALLLIDTVGLTKSLNDTPATSLLNVIGIPLVLFIFVAAVVSQVYRYFRHSNAIQRQQTKWVLGAIILFVISVVFALMAIALAQTGQKFTADDLRLALVANILFALVGAFFPISVGIAILRYRLWDIDIIIRRTLIYSMLTVTLAIVYLSSVILLQQIFRALTGAGGDLAIIISTLMLAALFNPLRHRIQDLIDNRFYRRKYDAQKILARFGATARDEVELEKLTGELLQVVDETMQPSWVSLWLKKNGNPGN